MTVQQLVAGILARGHECQIIINTEMVGLTRPKVRIWGTVRMKGPKDSSWRTAGTIAFNQISIYSYEPLPGYDGTILENAMTEGGA